MHTHTSHEVRQAMAVIEREVHRVDPEVEAHLSVYRWNEDDVIDVDLMKGNAEIHFEVSCDRALEHSTMEPAALEHDLEEVVHDLNRRAVTGPVRPAATRGVWTCSIRPAHDADRTTLARLWSESGLDVPADSEWASMIGGAGSQLHVAESAGIVVGVILATFDGRRAYIYRLAVDAGHRLGGVGAALVRDAEASLGRRGVCQVFAMVDQGNTSGMAFCEAMGYEANEVAFVKEIC